MTAPRNSAQRRAASSADLARSGEPDTRIEVVDYDASWPQRFSREAVRVAQLANLELHHIGSTAVPGLAAKPIIDMMALVEDLDAALSTLTDRAGYQFPIAYNATLTGRRWLCRPSASHRTHHLHLVADPHELARHLGFRDALRRDRQLAQQYADLKRDLARRMPNDREGYTAAKTVFISRVDTQF